MPGWKVGIVGLERLCEDVLEVVRGREWVGPEPQRVKLDCSVAYLLPGLHVCAHVLGEDRCMVDVWPCEGSKAIDAVKIAVNRLVPVKRLKCQAIRRPCVWGKN